MTQSTSRPPLRDTAINIRASARQRDLIDRASEALGKSRTDFMLDSDCREAIDILLDQRVFQLDEKAFDEFSALLDSPPPPSDDLDRLLKTRPPWE